MAGNDSLWMFPTFFNWKMLAESYSKIATVPALLETTQTSEFLKFHSWCLGKRQYIAISGVFGQKLQRCPGPECWRLVAVAGKNTSLVKGIHRSDKLQWRDVTNSLGEHFKNLHKHCKVEEEICVSSPISKAVQRKYTRIRCDVECSLRRQDVRG
jgi:hypothetical protein